MRTISNEQFDTLVGKYIRQGGTATQIWEGVLLHGDWILHSDCGKLKTIIIKEVYVNSWSSEMTIRMYNKMPKKYAKMLEEFHNREIFARKDSKTGLGMNAGYVFGDGDMYFAKESDALEYAQEQGYESLKDSYEDEYHYFTEWEVDDTEDEYYDAEGNDVDFYGNKLN